MITTAAVCQQLPSSETLPAGGTQGQAAGAQGQAAAPTRLTLDQALSLAEKTNPQLRAAAAQREGAAAGITTARQYPNPEFSFMAGQQLARQILTPGTPGLLQHYSVFQPLELPSYREARIAEANFRREGSDYFVAESRLAVRALVKQAFYEILRRRGEVEIARENFKLIEELRRRIQVQVDVGEAARLELTRAESEVAISRTAVRSAELRLVSAFSALRAAVAAPLPPDFDPQGQLDSPPVLPPLDQLRDDVLSRHPVLLQASAEIQRANARLRTEKALRYPQPAVRTEYEHQPDLYFYRFGISLPVPLWNRREGQIGEAEASVSEATSVAEFRRLELTAALERAYGLYQVANQQVASFQEGVIREATAAVQAAEAAYRFGERGIIEVLDAQRVLRSVNLDYLNAQYDRQAALIELERLRAIDPGINTP